MADDRQEHLTQAFVQLSHHYIEIDNLDSEIDNLDSKIDQFGTKFGHKVAKTHELLMTALGQQKNEI
jgi:hypothetical protein